MERSISPTTQSPHGSPEIAKPGDLVSLSALQDRVRPLKDETDDCCARKVQDFLKEVHEVQMLSSAQRDATANATKQILKTRDVAQAVHNASESGAQVRQAVESVTKSRIDLTAFQEQLGEDISAITSRNVEIYNDMDKIRAMWKEMWNFIVVHAARVSAEQYRCQWANTYTTRSHSFCVAFRYSTI
eukprot:GEMP01076255.1.p1 GENE.GEMP01076255.1~~GEMP01076255.1.p1  ORF type:complete len:187 (+),score=25.98 GEMP01076255.1:318-878(+)